MPNFNVKERETAPSTTTQPDDGPRNCPHAELPKWADGNLERLAEVLGT